jgi:hypothetical protein
VSALNRPLVVLFDQRSVDEAVERSVGAEGANRVRPTFELAVVAFQRVDRMQFGALLLRAADRFRSRLPALLRKFDR